MAQQTINVGAAPNDGTGTPLRTAFQYTNSNFSELYTAVGPSGNNIVVPGNATITGDLTVDTNVLKVDTTLNRVGIGTATPVSSLQVLDGDITVTTGGSFSGFNGTRQTVPSSVGTQLSRLHFSAYSTGTTYVQGASIQSYSDAAWSASSAPAYLAFYTTPSASVTLSERYRIASDGVATWSNVGGVAGTAMTLNSTGLGVGVTPSAWLAAVKAIDIGSNALAAYSGGITHNAYFDNTDSRWEYKGTGAATFYSVQGGLHSWYVAASGTANVAITTFSSAAMTLDASGNLLVTKTSPNATVVGFQATSTGETSSTMASAVSAQSTFNVYSTGAAAYRFYVGMNGTINATNTTIAAISDQRLKENIQDIDVGLGAILALKPRKFDWKAGKGKDIKGDRGFIAQEFEQVFPNLIDEWKDPAPEGEAPYKSVRQDLIPVLVKAIQELAAEVNALKNA